MLNYFGRLNASLKVSCSLCEMSIVIKWKERKVIEGNESEKKRWWWCGNGNGNGNIHIQYLRNSNRQTNRIHQFNRHIYSWNLHKFRHAWTTALKQRAIYNAVFISVTGSMAGELVALLTPFPIRPFECNKCTLCVQCTLSSYTYKCRNLPLIRVFISKIICFLIGSLAWFYFASHK